MKSSLIGICFVWVCFVANAQRNMLQDDAKYLNRNFHFGIALSMNTADYKVNHSATFATDSFLTIKSPNSIGFGIGVISSYHIHKNLELRYLPSVTFVNRSLRYTTENTIINKTVEAIYIQNPILLKFKTDAIGEFKLYVIAGMNYSYDLAAKMKSRRVSNMIKINRHDISIDYGVGVEIHFPTFILCPEFKVSNSFLNILQRDPQLNLSNNIKSLLPRMFTFSLNFEG